MKLKSCCCFDLRTGGLIIGWLGIILSILILVLLPINATKGYKPDGLIGIILTQFAFILVEAQWIRGIRRNNDRIMLPSVILSVIGCVLVLILIVLAIIGIASAEDEQDILTLSIILVLILLFGVLGVYFTFVKYFLYKEIREENLKRPAIIAIGDGVVYKFPV